MSSWHFSVAVKIVLGALILTGCQTMDFTALKLSNKKFMSFEKGSVFVGLGGEKDVSSNSTKSLNDILTGSLADVNQGTDFVTTISMALQEDPAVIAQRKAVEASLAAIGSREAGKEYQVTSTLYAGIEDITDNTSGVALGLNASRLLFDGGLLEAQIASKRFEAEASKLNLQAIIDDRGYILGEAWLELERYQRLQKQIDARLAVLDPLIGQLEQVAKAGIGDVSKVTAAQRTVSGIRVTQTNISEGLAKARLDFLNAFGSVNENIRYNAEFVENLLPSGEITDLAQQTPMLMAKYAIYQANLSNLEAIRAKREFNIGFEARAMRPFAGSDYDSDESVGFVATKTLFNGGMFESEINEAKAIAESALADVKAAYRTGEGIVKASQQSIESMDNAIRLARENARLTADEIVYLRQQLIIGGSTLDSVLSAEARLYEAEAKEINFMTDKRKAQLRIVAALGLLSKALEIE